LLDISGQREQPESNERIDHSNVFRRRCRESEADANFSLTAVFDLVAWWTAEKRAVERAHKALRSRHINAFENEEPFAAVIRCTADREKVDKRTRSKWSRALRYALRYKSHSEPLDQFIKRKGGINSCASRFTRCLEGAAARASGLSPRAAL
jgi:hypothetical protein